MLQGQERFLKNARLTRRSDFLNLSRGGKKIYTQHFIVVSKFNHREIDRLGVTVSKKVGKAVVRNRVKRHLREFFRRQPKPHSSHRDILVIARKGAGNLSHFEVVQELGKIWTYKDNRKKYAKTNKNIYNSNT